jgi:hypothetical protein
LESPIISGNSGGCSDITLYNTAEDKYIFVSSKYPKDNEEGKSVSYYDIQNIVAMVSSNKEIYKNYEIFLLVPDKFSVLDKAKKANTSSDYITQHMKESNILDKNDLQKFFSIFKQSIVKYKFENYDEVYLSRKESLQLRFHQEMITSKTSKLIQEKHKQFLWAAKCRSGKTYMVGGLINKQKQIKPKLNVLIITPAPTETSPQFTEDLFNKFIDFKDFKIHNIENSKSLNSLIFSDNNIFVLSKQLIQKYIKENTIKSIKDLNLDLIVFDENHFSGTTDLSKEILKSYESSNTVRLYLTATYNKPLKEWNIPSECQMYWDIEDEQICKSILQNNLNIGKLHEKHGDIIVDVVKYFYSLGITFDDIFKPYLTMPNLHLITNMFDSERYENIKSSIEEMKAKYGFSFEALFSLNSEKSKFNYEKEVKTLLQYISGSDKIRDYPKGDFSIFSRIFKLCSEQESRIPFTQIWFLPPNNIDETSRCLKEQIAKDSTLSKYNVMIINSKNKDLAKDVKEEISKQETIARGNNKEGLILLAGNMLSLGITLNNCDAVFLMNNTLSSDKVMQQMYRCMTESSDKKMGFVVDLNISRVLNTCINYGIYKKDYNVEDKIRYLIENHLINIDNDLFRNKSLDSNKIVSKLMEIWKSDPINNLKTLLRNLDNDYIEFDNDTQRLLNKSFTSSSKDKVNITVKVDEENSQELPNGRETVINTDSEDESVISSSSKKKEQEIQISFTKDVLPYVIPLSCILTIKDNNKDFIEMLNNIKNNPELLEIFNEQSLIWWNKKDLIDLIKDIVEKYFDKKSNTYNISIQFKDSIKSLIDNPKELLEIINECLKPKDVEKKQFGEVFTPMKLVNEMLDKLPTEVWKNKNLKWFDPASGMGNFPIAVYLRLMESLKTEIIDDSGRKKYILENMLYMSELNKKNVYICQQIFDINNSYKLNIYNGDSLELNISKEFKVDNFDIIIGNPPYQEADATGDNKLYLDFTKNSLLKLKEKGLLLFITPTNVKNYITCQNKNRDYIDNLYNIKFLSINVANSYFKVGSTFAYFLIEKEIVNETTTSIEFLRNNIVEKDIINIKKGYNLPLCISSLDINIINKVSNLIENKHETFDIKKAGYLVNEKITFQRIRNSHISSGKISKIQNDIYKYKIIDKITKSNPFPGVFYFNDKEMIDYNIPKIIMCTGGYLIPEYDEKGEYNLSDNMIYLLCDSQKKYNGFKNIVNSKLINYLNKVTMTDGLHGRDKVISNIKICDLENINNDEDIYKIFNITDDEKNIIEKTLGINN